MDSPTPPATDAIRDALDRARSWKDAERNLAALTLHLRPRLFRGGGVYVTDRDDNQWPVKDFWSAGVPDLNAKYGVTFDEHSRELFAGYLAITGMSYEELRRRERY